MDIIIFIVVAIITCFVLFGIGQLLRGRSRWVQILVMAAVAVVVFLSVALFGSSIGVDLYESDHAQACEDSTPKCVAEREQMSTFRSRAASLILWRIVPKTLRPACETISPEFCVLEKNYDIEYMADILGLISAPIAVFMIYLGLRQKRKIELHLTEPLHS